jgi:hypothetical protein
VTARDDVVCVLGVPGTIEGLGIELERERRASDDTWLLSVTIELPPSVFRRQGVQTAGDAHFYRKPGLQRETRNRNRSMASAE